MDIAAVGTALGGAGQFLGGIGFGSKKSDPVATQAALQDSQGRHELYMQKASFDQKMQLAKDHGLHPLVMAGVPLGGFSPAISVSGGDSGFDPALAGAGVANIARSFVKPPEDPLSDEVATLNLRILRANAARAEWEALGTEFRVADMAAPSILMGQPGNPPGARLSNDAALLRNLAAEQSGIPPSLIGGGAAPITMKQDILPPHPSKLGHAAGTDQSNISVVGNDGKILSMPNPQIFQGEVNELFTFRLLQEYFGTERATEIMAAVEQKGLLGGLALAAGGAGKLIYDRLARQRRDAESRSKSQNFKSKRGYYSSGPPEARHHYRPYSPGMGWTKGGD